MAGKWHLGQRNAYLPASHGFDEWLGLPYSVDQGAARTTACGSPELTSADRSHETRRGGRGGSSAAAAHDAAADFLPLLQQTRPAASAADPASASAAPTRVLEQPADLTTLTAKLASFATAFIRKHSAFPFFLYFAFAHVHTSDFNQPGNQYAGCDFRGATRRGGFGDALAEVDWVVEQLMGQLEASEVIDNTLVLFTGDNGPWLARTVAAGSAGLFQGRYAGYWNTGKGSTWEGGIREPAFVPSRSSPTLRWSLCRS